MITYFTASKTLDFIIEGIDEYIGVTIISSHCKEIQEMIVHTMGRGVTIYKFIYQTKASKREETYYKYILPQKGIDEVREDVEKWAEQRSAEIELLKNNEAYRKEFLQNLAHEFKTPIFAIQGYVETPLNMIVIRFTQDGMPVKSIAVPDVEATAVPLTIGYSVPVGTVAVPANVVFRPVLIVMASEPPIWMAPEPSVFPFSPIGMMITRKGC